MATAAVTDTAAPSVDLTEVDARALLADIRTAISAAQYLLRLAWRQRIWVQLGHASWDAFVAAELGDLRLKLPVDDRRVEVGAWRAEGASVRAIASALGVSTGTVASDLHTVEGVSSADTPEGVHGDGHPRVVVSLDGRRRPGTQHRVPLEGPQTVRTPRPVGTSDGSRPVSLRVLDALAVAGADGLTLVEVSRRLKTRDGSSSGALSRLEAQGHCARAGERRDGRSVYVLAWILAGDR